MKKVILVGTILIVLISGILFVRFVLGGDEDSWICVNGSWVKHGNPSKPVPTDYCGKKQIASFDECILAGYPALESYPRQCKTSDGKTFTEDIGNELEKADLIRIDNPRPNQIIQSPLKISGEARGFWFFEASFPIILVDEQGEILGQTIAQAKDDWMTESFVPFEATLEFGATSSSRGELIFKKDNPSGLAENDDELRIPVGF